MTFRSRLVLAMAAVSTFGLATAGGTAYLVERLRVDQRIEASLMRAVQELRNYAGVGTDDSAQQRDFTAVGDVVHGAVNQSVNAEDECTLGSVGDEPWTWSGSPTVCERVGRDAQLRSALRVADPDDAVAVRHVTTGVGEYAFVSVPVSYGTDPMVGRYAVVVDRGAQLGLVRDTYLRVFAPVALATLAIVVLAAWALAGQTLRPLRSLAQAAQDVSGANLSHRVPVSGTDEVTTVARAINTMLDSLEEAFRSQRQLLDDVGHELRTPLTIVRGHLELADPADPSDVESTRALVLDEVDRMRQLTDSLVTLARADAPQFVHLAPCALAPLVDEVFDKARALADRQWVVEARDEVTVLADAQRLTQALLELATNAVRHSTPASVVAFGVRATPEGAELSVRDEGDGIPVERQATVFERFARLDGPTRGDGAGLGLAIVERIAAAHGGRVRLASVVGQGTTVILVLPRQGRPDGGVA